MNLFQINSKIENFEFEIDEETGEILNMNELDQLEMDKSDKIENIALYIKNLKADEEALDNEYRAMYSRKKAVTKKRQSLEDYLKNNVDKKFETPKCVISFRKSTQVDIPKETEQDFIDWARKHHPNFINETTTVKPVKKEIMKALKDGEIMLGASLREERNIQIK